MRAQPSASMMDEARGYLERQFSVIPLTPPEDGGKKPLLKWKEFQNRQSTLDEIERWFTSTRNNIGIVTGSISGLVVVDCDDEEAVEWAQAKLAETNMVTKTGSGFHLFYRHPSVVVPNGAKIQGRNLDVRGDGGYVVAPPSVHESGQEYRKLGNWEKDPPVFHPSWIVRKTLERTVQTVSQDVDFIRLRARRYVARIFSVSGQGGDMNLFRAACALCQKFELPEDAALEELRVWNETNAVPPWGDDRLQYKIDQAMRLKS